MENIINPIDEIVKLLKDPNEEWYGDSDEIIIKNLKTGISIWVTGAPILETHIYHPYMELSLIEKWKIWRAVKICKRNRLTQFLRKNDEKT